MQATSEPTTTETRTGMLRTVATELSALGRLALSMPLRPLLAREGFDGGAPHPTPVVLVHGFLGDPTNFLALRQTLRDRGIRNVYTFSYLPRLDYHRLACQLARAIETICEETGAPQVDVVGHSLGGLFARYMIEMGKGGRVRRFVTLGAPYFGPRTVGRELGIFAEHDLLIPVPHPTCGFRSRVVVIPDCGHCGLLLHETVLRRVAHFLSAPRACGRHAGVAQGSSGRRSEPAVAVRLDVRSASPRVTCSTRDRTQLRAAGCDPGDGAKGEAMSRHRIWMFAGVLILAAAHPAYSKKVVCVDNANDAFTNNHEGYQRVGLGATDYIQVGGNLTDCLKKVANGDALVIVAHGVDDGANFVWDGNKYPGFGTGAGYALPDDFDKLMNVTVDMCNCFSARDPDGPRGADISLVDKMVKAMGGAGNKNTVSGFNDYANTEVIPAITGTPAETKAVFACMAADNSWLKNPPANRPDTGGNGQPANQLTALKALIANCNGAGNATAAIPSQVGTPGKVFGYAAPWNSLKPSAQSGAADGCGCNDLPGCGFGRAEPLSDSCPELPCPIPAKDPSNVVTITDCSVATASGSWTQINLPGKDVVLQCPVSQLPGTYGIRILAHSIKVDGAAGGSVTAAGKLGVWLRAGSVPSACDAAATVEVESTILTSSRLKRDLKLSACGDIVVTASLVQAGGNVQARTDGRICASNDEINGNRVLLAAGGDVILRDSEVTTQGPRDLVKITSKRGSVLAGESVCGWNVFEGGNESNMVVTGDRVVDLSHSCVEIAENITVTALDRDQSPPSQAVIDLQRAELRNDFGKAGTIGVTAAGGAGRIDVSDALLVDVGSNGGGPDPQRVSGLNGGTATQNVNCAATVAPTCSARPIDPQRNPVSASPTGRGAHNVTGVPRCDT